MMMRRQLLSAVAVLWLAACGSSTDETDGLVQIEVVPANATITYDNAPAAPIAYTAIGHYADGHTAELTAVSFSLDEAAGRLGALAGTEFTASGAQAGTGAVGATAGTVTGQTGVSVVVRRATIDPSAPPGAPGMFPDNPPTGPASPVIVYPLEGAVMPSTVKAPTVQWEGPAVGGDAYRVRMVGGLATSDTYLGAGAMFTFSALPLAADWQLIVASAGGLPISITVDHWDAASGAQGGAPVRFKAVPADVAGVIYYWDLSQGQIQRIDVAGRARAIPNPPPKPTDAGNRCVACHVISRDGRYLAGELWGGAEPSAVFDLSDPAVRNGDPAPVVNTGSYQSLFSTFNPDASRLLINYGTQLQLVDPKSGTSVATAGVPLPAAGASHPTWSPDGTQIAYVANISSGGGAATWAVDYDRGDLAVIPVTGPDTFGAPVTLVPVGDPAFAAPSWPSFTPDSTWIAYGAGVNSRGRNAGTVYPGSLFMVPRAGGAPVRLDTACSGARNCYLPNFSPYDTGDYIWLAFYSQRDYGNAQAGTKGTSRRQMWVTAIDKTKLGSGDPSMVPYWIPDQDAQTDNMSAFWAVPPPLQ